MKVNRQYMKYTLMCIFNILLFYCLFHWLLGGLHARLLWESITQVKISSLMLIASFDFLITLFYGYRLMLLLNTSFFKAWTVVCIGNGFNNLMPFRLGDVLRIYFGRQFYQFGVGRMIAATCLERYCDLFLLLLFGILVVAFDESLHDNFLGYILIILFVFVVVTIFMYRLLITKASFLHRYIKRFSLVLNFIDCLQDVVNAKCRKQLIVTTLLIWSFSAALYYLFFNINIEHAYLSLHMAILLCLMTTLAFAVPYAIAGIGIFESVIVYYLVNFLHLPLTQSVALAIVFHFAFAVPQILIMLIVFLHRKLRSRYLAQEI